jgi:hypothetical protein
VFGRIGREVAEHPAETAALLTMALALSRLLPRSRAGKRGRVSRGVLPLGVMAALCILGLSA